MSPRKPRQPTALTSAATTASLVALLAFSVFVIVNALRSNPRRNPGLLVLMLAPWAYIRIRDWLSFDPFRLTDLAYPLPVIAVWLLRPGLRQLRLLGYLVAAVAAISVALGVLLPSHGIFRSAAGAVITEDKNILPWGMLVGIYTHGNSLGQFLALGIPMVTPDPANQCPGGTAGDLVVRLGLEHVTLVDLLGCRHDRRGGMSWQRSRGRDARFPRGWS